MSTGPAAAAGVVPGKTTPRRRAVAVASVAVLVAVLLLGAWYLWTHREEIAAAVAEIGPAAALGCLGLTVVGVLATGECWRVWLGSLAAPPPPVTAHRVFYLTQAGKYLPGSLWPFLAQALLARRFGVPRTAMLTATSLFLLTHVVTGVVVGVVGVGPSVAAGWAWLLYPAAAAGLVVLCPPVLARVVTLADRLRGREGQSAPTPSWCTVGRAVLLMLLAWAAYGGATWLLVRRLADGDGGLAIAVGAYALAWVVGFLAVAAPAGVGAREAVVVLALGPLLGAPAAFSVALVSRVALTVVDLGLAALSSGVLREVVAGLEAAAPSAEPSPDPGR